MPTVLPMALEHTFSYKLLMTLFSIAPLFLNWRLRGNVWTFLPVAGLTSIPVMTAFWTIASRISPRKNEKVKYTG